MTKKPRTWTDELMHDGTVATVIELEPVLDDIRTVLTLLQRWRTRRHANTNADLLRDTTSAEIKLITTLREHGRLS